MARIELTPEQIEDCSKFKVGDYVAIEPGQPWSGDWANQTMQVVGVVFDVRQRQADYWLLHDGDQVTTDFRASHLVAAPKPVKKDDAR